MSVYPQNQVILTPRALAIVQRISKKLAPHGTPIPTDTIIHCALQTYEKDLDWLANASRNTTKAVKGDPAAVEPGDGMPPVAKDWRPI